jgi:glycosyltransferase involved in cell wall biosynthesis
MGIEFIIPTYSRTNHLITIVGSILSQTNPNWKIHIVGDCVPNSNLELIHSFLNMINDSRIRFTNLPERYNDWGHTPRNYGLKESTLEWTIMTGEDNYYVPSFVDNMLKMGDKKHFVFCSMVHNWIEDNYIPINSEIKYGKIDIGCYMFKTNMGKKLKLDTKISEADWLFIEDFNKKYPLAIFGKVNKLLYVHN